MTRCIDCRYLCKQEPHHVCACPFNPIDKIFVNPDDLSCEFFIPFIKLEEAKDGNV